MNILDRESEIAQLSTLYGTPVRQRYVLHVSNATIQWWASEKCRQRAGEVVLFIRLHNGDLLLHTKDFYPAGVFRVPSGGIKTGEGLCDAVRREALEETGLEVAIERFLAVIEFEFRCQELIIPYPSYL
ncbi:MAG: NUDIX hydrolase, partial [Chloroflexi bacterium]|nr:NUDIX hydrolase [Chloroflexota bacterium]